MVTVITPLPHWSRTQVEYMPARNSRKIYAENAVYHVYNRGLNKNIIFKDQKDYNVFLKFLKDYLLPINSAEITKRASDPSLTVSEKKAILQELTRKNFSKRIDLLAYCLMPNHFHLMLYQKDSEAMTELVQSLTTRYTIYFNKRHKRTGTLFQGRYKAVLVDSEPQLLHLSRYIHQNPLKSPTNKLNTIRKELMSQPSSYDCYVGNSDKDWVKPEMVLSNFGKNGITTYKSFVESVDDGLAELEAATLQEVHIDAYI